MILLKVMKGEKLVEDKLVVKDVEISIYGECGVFVRLRKS